jgi:hypothetical protein
MGDRRAMQNTPGVPLTVTVSERSGEVHRVVFAEHARALADYRRRIAELEAEGYLRDGSEVVVYGSRWSQAMRCGDRRATVELAVSP